MLLELEQSQILNSKYKKILANSCAGTGKTEVQVRRCIKYAIHNNYNILNITFTHSNKINISKRMMTILDKNKVNYSIKSSNLKTFFVVNNNTIRISTIDSCVDTFVNEYLSENEYNSIRTDFQQKYIYLKKWINKNKTIPLPFSDYDVIIIDEWQDIGQSYLKMEIMFSEICFFKL